MFLKLKYPVKLVDSIFKTFHATQDQNQSCIELVDSPVLITLPFKDQKSADSLRRQLSDLSKKIDRVLQPVFTSRKISEDLKITETKPSLVNQQCVVYEFQCNSCDSNYIFTIQYPVPLFSLCTKSLIAVLKDAKQLSEENGGGPFC